MDLMTATRLGQAINKPCIALIGAGGKSSLLFQLGHELGGTGLQTVLTATTRLWSRQMDRAPFSLVSADEHLLARELPISLRGYRQVLVLSGPAPEPDKMRGLPPETVCRLLALADVDAVVVEADGSRERPLKAPAGHEPVVPVCATHVITVVGLNVPGKPLDPRWVHRPDKVAALTGMAAGDLITPEAVAHLAVHPAGGLRGHPAHCRSMLFLNLLGETGSTRLEQARRIARVALAHVAAGEHGYDAVLVGDLAGPDPVAEVHGRVAGIVLAAGRGSRLGGDVPKQLLPWGEAGTLVRQAAETALASPSLDEVLVVTGYQADAVEGALADLPVRIVRNPDWSDGQSASVRTAVQALSAEMSAAVFLLADQPAVTPDIIEALIDAHRHTLAPVVAPVYQGGRRGNPVLFDRSTFAELATLTGDAGGRSLFQRYEGRLHDVPVDRPQPEGVETLDDYRRLAASLL